MIATWPCPGGDELALAIDRGRHVRLLILPALFDEANRLRHFTVQLMRLLDGQGVDSLLPDLPGCNESAASLAAQTLAGWRDAALAAARHFHATHILAIRAGALIAPDLPGWRYAPQDGAGVLRAMLRVRLIASKEAGIAETREELMETARANGLELLGYRIGASLFRDLENACSSATPNFRDIAAADLGGPALWLRAEPDHDPRQADALVASMIRDLSA